jgi:hypothetical protein
LVGFDEMILNPLATVETGQSGLLHHGQEVAVIHIAEHLRKSRLDQNSFPVSLVCRIRSNGVTALRKMTSSTKVASSGPRWVYLAAD